MTESSPDPAGNAHPGRVVLDLSVFLPRFMKFLKAMSVVAVFVVLGGVCSLRNSRKREKLIGELRQEHPGRIAWFDNSSVYVLEMASLSEDPESSNFTTEAKPRRVLWSSDGKTLFVVLARGTFNEIHRLDAIDIATGAHRTILDLATQNLDDDDFDLNEMWVIAWGEVESETDRIVFRLGTGQWYSVEGKRPRVRPEPGPPAKKWDQTKCPDGKHLLQRDSNDDDKWLELTDGDTELKISGKDQVRGEGAWYCAPK